MCSINYVLTKLPADLRDYIVGQLRAVAPNQQWGIGPPGRRGSPATRTAGRWSRAVG